MQKTIAEKIVEGSIIIIGLAEAAHLTALFLKLPLHVCSVMMGALFLCAIFYAILTTVLKKRKQGAQKEKGKENRFWKLLRVYPLLFGLIGLAILLQLIWNYWMHVPYLEGDITGETVQTMLASDGIYTLNPMTGRPFTEGMPMRLKILVLPTLFASVCQFSSVPVQLFVYSIVPSLVLLLSYLVYSSWAVWLFPQEGKKQAMFMLFVILVYQFGCYSGAMDSFLLFFQGYQGAAFRAGVILPYALLSCLKNNWKSVLLCLLTEVCVVWTFYGLGYTVITVAVVLGIRLIRHLLDRRKKV